MTNELKQEYALKITQANKTQLIVILYEMLLGYVTDAKKAYEANDKAEFREGIKRARGCVMELMDSLHFEYDIAGNILQLYLYVNRELAGADVKKTTEPLDHILIVVQGLREAYLEVSKQDNSQPIMSNTQSIYAGLTYGRNNLKENLSGEAGNRGFLA